MLFSKWNSFSRIGVYERPHGDWSLSGNTPARCPRRGFMDIDSAASTPILQFGGGPVGRAVPALRAHRAGYHLGCPGSDAGAPVGSDGSGRPRSRGRRVHRAGHRTGRRARPGVGAGVRRAARRRRRDQPDHRQRRDARPVPRVLGRHLRPSHVTSPSTTAAASSGGRRTGTTSSRRRWSTPGRRPRPAPTRSPRTRSTPSRRSTTTSIT